jgi:hypothetical protein
MADDGKAFIDSEVRKALANQLGPILVKEPAFKRLEKTQQFEVERLVGLLDTVVHLPGNQCASSTKTYLDSEPL